MDDRSNDSDQDLVERARRAPDGDVHAFEQLVERHQSRVLANCRYLSRSPSDAEDPTVETFDELRVAPTAEGRIHSTDERERIGGVLDRISDTLRVPLILRDMDEFSYQEIAEFLGIGLSAVKMRIKRGREEFRRIYDREETPR